MKYTLLASVVSVSLGVGAVSPAFAHAPLNRQMEAIEPDTGDDDAGEHKRRFEQQKLRGRSIIGIRFGYEAALGDVTLEDSSSDDSGFENTELQTTSNKKLPIAFDVSVRPVPFFAIGGYAQAAIVMGGETDFGASLGALISVHPKPASNASFWFGSGFGYQWLSFREGALRGIEIVPQLGVDLRTSRHFAMGPYADVHLTYYTSEVCQQCSGTNSWAGIGYRVSWL